MANFISDPFINQGGGNLANIISDPFMIQRSTLVAMASNLLAKASTEQSVLVPALVTNVHSSSFLNSKNLIQGSSPNPCRVAAERRVEALGREGKRKKKVYRLR